MSRSRRKLRALAKRREIDALRVENEYMRLAIKLGMAHGERDAALRELKRWKPQATVTDRPDLEALELKIHVMYDTLRFSINPDAVIRYTLDEMREQLLRAVRSERGIGSIE